MTSNQIVSRIGIRHLAELGEDIPRQARVEAVTLLLLDSRRAAVEVLAQHIPVAPQSQIRTAYRRVDAWRALVSMDPATSWIAHLLDTQQESHWTAIERGWYDRQQGDRRHVQTSTQDDRITLVWDHATPTADCRCDGHETKPRADWHPSLVALIDDEAEWTAVEQSRIGERRARERNTGIDPSPFEHGSREMALARTFAAETPTRRSIADLVAERWHRLYKPRSKRVEAFVDETITQTARMKYRQLAETFTPEPMGYTESGRPIPPTAAEREEQRAAFLLQVSADAIAYAERLRDIVPWPELAGRIGRHTAQADDAQADATDPTDDATDATPEGEDDRAEERAAILRAARLSARDTFTA